MENKKIEKQLIEPLVKLYINNIKQTKLLLDSNNISIKVWLMELNSLIENEPLSIFKKKHSEWEEKVKDISKHLNDLYKSSEEIMEDLEELKLFY